MPPNNINVPYQPVYIVQNPDGSCYYSTVATSSGGAGGHVIYNVTGGGGGGGGSGVVSYAVTDPGHSHSCRGSYSYSPSISLSKFYGGNSLEKVEDKIWKIANLTFDIIISLQEAGITYKWKREADNIYICFESEAEESLAIMVLTEDDQK